MWVWNVVLKLYFYQSSFSLVDIVLVNISGGVFVLVNDNLFFLIMKGLKEKNSMVSYMFLVILRFGYT